MISYNNRIKKESYVSEIHLYMQYIKSIITKCDANPWHKQWILMYCKKVSHIHSLYLICYHVAGLEFVHQDIIKFCMTIVKVLDIEP